MIRRINPNATGEVVNPTGCAGHDDMSDDWTVCETFAPHAYTATHRDGKRLIAGPDDQGLIFLKHYMAEYDRGIRVRENRQSSR